MTGIISMRLAQATSLALMALCPTAIVAQAQPLYAGDAQRLELKNLAANVFIIPEGRDDIDIKVRYGKAKIPTLLVSKRGDTTVLNGQMPINAATHGFNMAIRITDDAGQSSGRVTLPRVGNVNIKDLPIVYVRVPKDAHIQDNGIVFGQVAASQSLELISCGRGVWNIASVNGTLNIIGCGASDIAISSAMDGLITSTGSGTIEVDSLKSLKANLTGSGGLSVRRVTSLELQNQGSGDIEVGHTGLTSLKLGGSGDISIKSVSGGLIIINNGAADVDIGQLNGPLKLDMAGSGDVSIGHGTSSDISIRGYGSGDVYFGGQGQNVTIDSYGSGDVTIVRATGAVITRVRGSGDMDIGH